MINLISKIHRFFFTKNELQYSKYNRNSPKWYIANIVVRLCNTLLFTILKIRGIHLPNRNSGKVEKDVIITLTSFPARINSVWMVIDSIFNQSVLPEKICLYLSKDEFPLLEKELPVKLLQQQSGGLKIVFLEGNIRSHKKYYSAFQEYGDKIVITIDDDLYYRSDMIANLLTLHKEYPNAICCSNASFISNLNGFYNEWKRLEVKTGPSQNVLAIGFGGVLYPAPYLLKKDIFDKESIMKLAPTADDLWLKAFSIMSGIDTVVGGYRAAPCTLSGTSSSALRNINTAKAGISQNDIQWNNIISNYNFFKLIANKSN